MEARYRHADGHWRYILTRRVDERDDAGEPIAFVGVALDMTEARRAAAPCRGAGAPARGRHRAAGVGIWSTTVDTGQAALERADVRAVRSLDAAPPAPSFGRVARRRSCRSGPLCDQRRSNGSRSGDERHARSSSARCARTAASAGSSCGHDVDARHHRPAPRPRHRHGRDRSAHRALDALREASERAAFVSAAHAGIGTWEADSRQRGRLERADVPPAWPRAAQSRPPSREEWMALRPSRRRARSCSRGRRTLEAAMLPVGATSSASACPTAAIAGSRRARPPCSTTAAAGAPRRRQLGHHRSQERRAGAPAGGRSPSARSRPSRSSSRA